MSFIGFPKLKVRSREQSFSVYILHPYCDNHDNVFNVVIKRSPVARIPEKFVIITSNLAYTWSAFNDIGAFKVDMELNSNFSRCVGLLARYVCRGKYSHRSKI